MGQGLGWVGIVASTWLTHIFMMQINHESTAHWDPEDWRAKFDLATWGGDLPWVRIVLLEHFLFIFKGYLAVAVQVESEDIMQHKEVVDKIFADAEPDTDQFKDAENDKRRGFGGVRFEESRYSAASAVVEEHISEE